MIWYYIIWGKKKKHCVISEVNTWWLKVHYRGNQKANNSHFVLCIALTRVTITPVAKTKGESA